MFRKHVFAKGISTMIDGNVVTMLSPLKTRPVSLFLLALLLCSVFLVAANGQAAKAVAAVSPANLVYTGSAAGGNDTNVILLGWDGVQRNHLYELLKAGLMPNLSGFIQTGKMVNVTVSDHYTDTKAGWTQILTGYRWWKTGVFANAIWFNTIPKNYTIPERLENYYGSSDIVTAFITGKLNQMEIEDQTGTAAVGSPFAVYSNQALYSNLPSALDVVSVGDLEQDRYADVVGPLTLQFIQNNSNNRFFGFFHFSDPDHTGHMYGENSEEYSTAIETCDYWLGQILGKLNTLGIAQKTLIYITADHGFDEDSHWHSNAPYIFLATNDNNVTRNGDEVDVAPTVYYGLGLWNQTTFSPALDGYPLQLNLSDSELQHRQSVLADTTNMPAPSISIVDTGPGQKTVTFSASDNNLVAVYLLVNGTLKKDLSLNWTNSGGTTTASGTYNINIAALSSGLYTVKVLALDEHGANNGGPGNDPLMGGSPSISSQSFTVGTQATASVSPTPPSSPSPTVTPSPAPKYTVSPILTPTQTVSSTQEPAQNVLPSITIYVAIAIVVIVVAGIGVYSYMKIKVKPRKN
jgi:hypothetical protein